MDAVTNAALDALEKECLPKLAAELAALKRSPAAKRAPSPQLRFLVAEARELLGLVATWSGEPETASGGEDLAGVAMSEDDAAMLAMVGGDDADAGGDDADEAATLAMEAAMAGDLAAGDEGTGFPDELGDALPDGALTGKRTVAESLAAEDESGGDMSDDEAFALLAQMDAPSAPAAADGDMSDDQARALLAEMDAPAAPSAGGDMSDAQARALLDEMDAPVAAAPKAPRASAAAAPAPAASADDEAMAMLRALGGDVVDMDAAGGDAPATPVEPAAAAAATGHGHDDEDEDPEDAPGAEPVEFAKNDFASDPEMIKDFLTNVDEILETLDAKVLELEQDPRNKECIESIFRGAHTLKGAAGMFGFKALERVMHRMENLFDQVRRGILVPSSATIDVVFQGLDVLRTLLEAVRAGKPSGMNTAPIVRALGLAAKGKEDKSLRSPRAGSEPKAKAALVADAPAAEGGGGAGGAGAAAGGGGGGDNARKSAEQSTIRVDLERLDALVNLVGELVIDRTRFVSIEEDLRSASPQVKAAGAMTETVQLFGRHMNEIHEIIMKIRMVPIGNAFNKFTRIVRDLARQLGKEIEIYLDGEDTELDKTLVEQIGDPLIHLIRNSCDHGIEMPDVREAAGKARGGKIFLSAQQEGNHIIITIADDGKGIPVDIVRRKAIEKGLIKEDAQMSQRDIVNLIFEPGFSTAEKVTTVSGRGVGMDVVKKQIGKLKGSIEIDSTQGKGTTTHIRLPLTLAIVQSLLVEVGGETFAMPLSTVIESVRIKPEDIQTVGDSEVIKRHGKVLPLLYLADALDIAAREQRTWYAEPARRELERRGGDTRPKHSRRKDRMYVVIVGNGERRFGIVVDQLLNQQEMVIKSLGPLMHRVGGVAGGAVLGNGEVVLVLDIQDLTDNFRTRTRHKGAA